MNRLADALLDVAVWLIMLALLGAAIFMSVGCDAEAEPGPCLDVADCFVVEGVDAQCLPLLDDVQDDGFRVLIRSQTEQAIDDCSAAGSAPDCENSTNEAMATALRCVVGES